MATVKELALRRASREVEFKQWETQKKSGKKSNGQQWKRPSWDWSADWAENGNSWSHSDDWGSQDFAGSSYGTQKRSQSLRKSEPEQEQQPRHRSHSRRRSRSARDRSPLKNPRSCSAAVGNLVHRIRKRVRRSRSRRRQHRSSSRHTAMPSRGPSEAPGPAPEIVFVTADSEPSKSNGKWEPSKSKASESLARQDRGPSHSSRGPSMRPSIQDRDPSHSSRGREPRNGEDHSRLGSQDAHPIKQLQKEVKVDVNAPDDLAEFASSASRSAFREISQKLRSSGFFKARPSGVAAMSRQRMLLSRRNGRLPAPSSTREESQASRRSGSRAGKRASDDESRVSLSTVTTQASLTDSRMRSSGFGIHRPKLSGFRRQKEGKGPRKAHARKGDAGSSAVISELSEQQEFDWSNRCRILGVDTSTDECGIELNMSKASLGDTEILQWCSWMGAKLSKHKGGYRAKAINFSDNSIGDTGASRLCRLLEMHKVSCEVFKLFRNDLNDESARDVGRYLTSFNRAPVAELHLSHNHITAQGLKWLMACLAMHPAYPRWSDEQQQFLPLWLRMEQNAISPDDARKLLLTINEELDISICFMNRHKCSPTKCCDPGAISGLKHNCVAHLPFYERDQGTSSTKSGMAPHSRPFFGAPLLRVPKGPRDAYRQKPFVLYEDDDIACVFKPANWVCNPDGINPKWQHWSKSDREDKLDEILTWSRPVPFHGWILLHFGRQTSFTPACAYGLAHRLDRDTSGPLLVGKTREGWQFCRDQINGRDLLKSYLCLVHGILEKPEGECHAPIDANAYSKTRQAKISHETGLPAISIYEALAQYEHPKTGERYTLVHVRIVTGRTHQIRLHMNYLGHSLVGERLYVKDRKVQRDDSDVCRTIFLHKCRIGFLTMDSKVTVRSCSLQMSEELWKALTKLQRLGASVNFKSLGSCGMPGAA